MSPVVLGKFSFAVVAEEVGNLAQMSGNAAKEIADMLSESIKSVEQVVKETGDSVNQMIEAGKGKVDKGAQIAEKCGTVLDEVVINVGEVKGMMTAISSGAEEQAEGVNNISIAMNELDESTHANSETASETSAYSESLATLAENLKDVVYDLEAEVFGKGGRVHAVDGEQAVGGVAATLKEKIASVTKLKPKARANKKQEPAKKAKKVSGDSFPEDDDPRFEDV